MKAHALLRVSLTVADLPRAVAFFTEALGFTAAAPAQDADPALAALLGAASLRTILLARGGQILELAAFDPPGAPYPPTRYSNDLAFQHIALVTHDIAAAYDRVCRHPHSPISRHGPQTLPGGIVAYKFRDAAGHPLELIQFPDPDPVTANGIDHSAISVSDAARSTAFYTDHFGLTRTAQQVNAGPAQDALDGLTGATVDVVALSPAQTAPHLELLAYRTPPGRLAPPARPADVAASRLVLSVNDLAPHPGAIACRDGTRAALMHDPDGHALLLLQQS